MTTTHLFVELLVIGFGALIWFFLIVATILGIDVGGTELDKLDWTTSIFPMLSLSYVLGIVTDRIADISFSKWEKRQRRDVYGPQDEDKKRYFRDRRLLLVEGPELWQFIEYGRSRLRICRGWALNSIIIMISFNVLWGYGRYGLGVSKLGAIGMNLLLLILAGLCTFAWARLHFREYEKIQRQSEWLRDHIRKTSVQEVELSGQVALSNKTYSIGRALRGRLQ